MAEFSIEMLGPSPECCSEVLSPECFLERLRVGYGGKIPGLRAQGELT